MFNREKEIKKEAFDVLDIEADIWRGELKCRTK